MTFSAETDGAPALGAPAPDGTDSSGPADFGNRFSAWMIDACLLFGVQTIVLLVLARQLQAAGLTEQTPCSPESPIMCEGPNTAAWAIVFAVMVLMTFGYHAWFDGRLGATPGKRWMGLRVVDQDPDARPGTPVGIARGLLRSVVRQGFWLWAIFFIAASPISLDVSAIVFFALLGLSLLTFLTGAFGPTGHALHDMAAGTRVERGHIAAPLDAPRTSASDPSPSETSS